MQAPDMVWPTPRKMYASIGLVLLALPPHPEISEPHPANLHLLHEACAQATYAFVFPCATFLPTYH